LNFSFAAVAASIGCAPTNSSPANAEPNFSAQATAVREGRADRIHSESTLLTDQDLAEAAGLAALRELLVDHPESRITSAGVKHLAGVPALEHLRLRGKGFDDAALAEAAKIESLQILNVPQADLTDVGLTELKRLPKLVQLRFGSPRVTDAGMKTLAELPSLKQLHLIDVPITDAGLAELAKIERLESLYIDGGTISDGAWEKLFRERPKLHVHVNQEHHDRDPHKHPH